MKPMKLLFSSVAAIGLMLSAGSVQAAPVDLSDGQILGVMNTVNDAEIKSGQVGVEKATKQEVKDLAAKLVLEHAKNNSQISALELKTQISRADSDARIEAKKKMDEMIDKLKKAKDNEFDLTFVDAQLNCHEELLKALDQVLIPTAENADVKSYLTETRASVEAHYKEIQDIRARL